MADLSFQSVPRKAFLAKMILPGVAVFCVGIGIMGLLADPTVFVPKPLQSASGQVEEIPASLEALAQGGFAHWRKILYFSTHVPEVCWSDNAVNDYQKKQCGEFWGHLYSGLALSFLPLALMLLFLKLATSSLKSTYRGARRVVEAARPIMSGVVTQPAQAPGDLFSWAYCLRPIGVQLGQSAAKGPKGVTRQIKVYIPRDVQPPLPGETMAVFEPVHRLGERRHFAVLYAPHVAVVSGTRTR